MQNIERIRMQNIQEEGWLKIIFFCNNTFEIFGLKFDKITVKNADS